MRRSLRIFYLGQEEEIQDERVSGFDPHKMDCKFQMVLGSVESGYLGCYASIWARLRANAMINKLNV
jgi:hypothetical protein